MMWQTSVVSGLILVFDTASWCMSNGVSSSCHLANVKWKAKVLANKNFRKNEFN